MKTISISGSARQGVGKRDAKQLRYEGRVPAVLYGGKEQVHFSVVEADLKDLVYTPNALFVELDIDGRKFRAFMQDIQFHPVTETINHVDFMELFDNKPVVMQIPVKFVGTSEGVKAGGKLIQKLRKLQVRALPADHQDAIEVNIESLEVGKSIRVSDLSFDKLTILNAKTDTIASVVSSRTMLQGTAEGEAAAPAAK